MLKVKLRPNVRYMEDFDTDFDITSRDKAKLLTDFELKSSTIKSCLLDGRLIPTEGHALFSLKSAKVCVHGAFPGMVFVHEGGKFLVKDTDAQKTEEVEEFPKEILKVFGMKKAK